MLPSLNLSEVKQDTVAIPIVLVALYLLVAFVAKERPARPTGHFITAFTALNGHATGRTLLACFLQTASNSARGFRVSMDNDQDDFVHQPDQKPKTESWLANAPWHQQRLS